MSRPCWKRNLLALAMALGAVITPAGPAGAESVPAETRFTNPCAIDRQFAEANGCNEIYDRARAEDDGREKPDVSGRVR